MSRLAFVFAIALPASGLHAQIPRLELELRLEPASRVFQAVAQFEISDRDGFLLHRSLEVRRAAIAGETVVPQRAGRHGESVLWRVGAPKGARVRIEYGGTLPELDRALDARGVLGAKPPMASDEGSYLPASGDWYPRSATLFTYRVSLSLPASQRGLVAGRLVSESLPQGSAGRYAAVFEFDHPADGIDLLAGPYVVRERMVAREGAAPLRLRTYFAPAVDALSDAYLEDSRRYIELYTQRIGAYPHTEFSVVSSPLPTGFGMPTMTYLGESVLKLAFIRATSLGHEVLHNWWGNGVFAELSRGNWSEGLTTFMADYHYKERESADAARETRLAWLRDFAALPRDAHSPLASFRSRTHGAAAALGYGKAAMVFFMLRDLIGEPAFERGARLLWESRQFRFASWDDLRSAFEQASGRSLQPFFAQWIERAGGPRLRVVKAELRDGKHLELDIEQSAPAYALCVPIEIVAPDRSETRWVDIQGERTAVTLDLAWQPQGVRLDPELRLWRVLDAEQLPPILRRWILARSPRLVLASEAADVRVAAASLAKGFFERAPQVLEAAGLAEGSEPALLVGRHAEIDAALARLGLPPRPARLAGRGTAQVWTVWTAHDRENDRVPLAVVSARDAEALRQIARALPHYGARSYLAFEGARAIETGVWSAPGRLIQVTARPGAISR
ncbi:MAG: M1 family peptidase [Betaproteobacteria bacterium]|nr:M1 family peptidase [Betaproteobacteria bacterium]